MVVKDAVHIADLDHADYLRHQWHEISSQKIEERAHEVKPANHFEFEGDYGGPNRTKVLPL